MRTLTRAILPLTLAALALAAGCAYPKHTAMVVIADAPPPAHATRPVCVVDGSVEAAERDAAADAAVDFAAGVLDIVLTLATLH